MSQYSNMSQESERQLMKSAKDLGIFSKILVLNYIYQAKFKVPVYHLAKKGIISPYNIKIALKELLDAGCITCSKRQYFMFSQQKQNTDFLFLSLMKLCDYSESLPKAKSKEWIEA